MQDEQGTVQAISLDFLKERTVELENNTLEKHPVDGLDEDSITHISIIIMQMQVIMANLFGFDFSFARFERYLNCIFKTVLGDNSSQILLVWDVFLRPF